MQTVVIDTNHKNDFNYRKTKEKKKKGNKSCEEQKEI